jgi:hypothetical protein
VRTLLCHKRPFFKGKLLAILEMVLKTFWHSVTQIFFYGWSAFCNISRVCTVCEKKCKSFLKMLANGYIIKLQKNKEKKADIKSPNLEPQCYTDMYPTFTWTRRNWTNVGLVQGTSYLIHLVTCLHFIVRLSATLGCTRWEVNIVHKSHVHRDTRQSAKYHSLVGIARCHWHCGYWCEAFHSQSPCCKWHEIIALRASPSPTSAQYVTPK